VHNGRPGGRRLGEGRWWSCRRSSLQRRPQRRSPVCGRSSRVPACAARSRRAASSPRQLGSSYWPRAATSSTRSRSGSSSPSWSSARSRGRSPPVLNGGAPLAGCNESCPANGLMIADRPNIAASFGSDMAWAVIVLLTATTALLVARLARASRPRRRTLLPVYVPALVLTIPLLGFHGFAAGVLHRRDDSGPGRLDRDRRPYRLGVRLPDRARTGEPVCRKRPEAAHGPDRRQPERVPPTRGRRRRARRPVRRACVQGRRR
jgi:hypothetical protein